MIIIRILSLESLTKKWFSLNSWFWQCCSSRRIVYHIFRQIHGLNIMHAHSFLYFVDMLVHQGRICIYKLHTFLKVLTKKVQFSIIYFSFHLLSLKLCFFSSYLVLFFIVNLFSSFSSQVKEVLFSSFVLGKHTSNHHSRMKMWKRTQELLLTNQVRLLYLKDSSFFHCLGTQRLKRRKGAGIKTVFSFSLLLFYSYHIYLMLSLLLSFPFTSCICFWSKKNRFEEFQPRFVLQCKMML